MIDVSSEERWLAEMLAAAGYTVIIVSSSFGGWRETWLYVFACPLKPRGRHILSVTAYSGRGKGEKGGWRK